MERLIPGSALACKRLLRKHLDVWRKLEEFHAVEECLGGILKAYGGSWIKGDEPFEEYRKQTLALLGTIQDIRETYGASIDSLSANLEEYGITRVRHTFDDGWEPQPGAIAFGDTEIFHHSDRVLIHRAAMHLRSKYADTFGREKTF